MAEKIVKTSTGQHGTTASTTQQKVRVWMQVIVSLVLLAAGFIVLVSPASIFPKPIDESTKRLATGWIGAVVGYWLS